MPTITVRYFAILREWKGRDQEEVDVPDGTTLGGLYRTLFPGPEGALPVACARNQEYAREATVVADGDEVAFLPPVGGG
jgi:molybdopterin converting factor subunit 1